MKHIFIAVLCFSQAVMANPGPTQPSTTRTNPKHSVSSLPDIVRLNIPAKPPLEVAQSCDSFAISPHIRKNHAYVGKGRSYSDIARG